MFYFERIILDPFMYLIAYQCWLSLGWFYTLEWHKTLTAIYCINIYGQ